EIGMIDRLAKGLGNSLSEGWSAVCETTVRYAGHIHGIDNPGADDLDLDLDDPNVLVSTARVALSGHAVKALEIVQPVDGLVAMEPQMHRPVSRETNRSEEHTSELQSRENLVCRLLLEKKKQRI